nr:MAG TPA_asm: hypothetical protein [Caudoviricetes sp.]
MCRRNRTKIDRCFINYWNIFIENKNIRYICNAIQLGEAQIRY